VIFNAGDVGDSAYVIIEGTVEISVPRLGPHRHHNMGKNDLLGEIAIGDARRSACHSSRPGAQGSIMDRKLETPQRSAKACFFIKSSASTRRSCGDRALRILGVALAPQAHARAASPAIVAPESRPDDEHCRRLTMARAIYFGRCVRRTLRRG